MMSRQVRITLSDNEYATLRATALAFAATTRDTWTVNDEARSRVIGTDLTDDPRQVHIYEWALDRIRAGLKVGYAMALVRLREFDEADNDDE